MKIINAENLIVGRIATVAAKNALLGEDVAIINSEKAVITGKKDELVARYKRKRRMGIPSKGPFLKRRPDMMLKRIIRGMLPYKQHKGRIALKRIKCYVGVPHEFKGKDSQTIKEANVSKMPNLKFMTLENISKILGGKTE